MTNVRIIERPSITFMGMEKSEKVVPINGFTEYSIFGREGWGVTILSLFLLEPALPAFFWELAYSLTTTV